MNQAPTSSNANKTEEENSITFLEGLPGCGKSRVCEALEKLGYTTIPEILDPVKLELHHNTPYQDFFFLNDQRKVQLAESMHRTVVVDRSPLSTLLFNLAKFRPNSRYELRRALNWYLDEFGPKFASRARYLFLLIDIVPELSLQRKGSTVSMDDPWRNPETLSFIRTLYLTLGVSWIKNFVIVDGSRGFESIFNEILAAVKNNA